MEFIALIFFTVTLLMISVLLQRKPKGKGKFPPGPAGISILGNLLQIVNQPQVVLSNWVEKYGEIYTIKLGGKTAIVINNTKKINDILGSYAGSGKFNSDPLLLISRGPYGLLNSDGDSWHEQRQFCLRHLKEFGFGKGSSEPIFLSEVNNCINTIKTELKKDPSCQDQGIEMERLMPVMVTSIIGVISSMIAGVEKTNVRDKISDHYPNYVLSMQKTVRTGLGFYPALKYIFPKWSGYEELDKASKKLHDLIENEFQRHKETYKEGVTRDLMDSYIEQLSNVRTPSSSFYGELGYKNTIAAFAELYAASGESTPSTFMWAVIYLALDQDIQAKLHAELDQVIGLDKDPTLEDKSRLPYLDAICQETLRYSSLVPLGVMHQFLEDMEYDGWYFPKDTIIMPNIYHVHHDRKIWGDPESFRPSRFLGESGKKLREFLIPFQPGRRTCPGSNLANNLFFLHLAKFFQTFEVKLDPKLSKELYLEREQGIVLRPMLHNKLILRERGSTDK